MILRLELFLIIRMLIINEKKVAIIRTDIDEGAQHVTWANSVAPAIAAI